MLKQEQQKAEELLECIVQMEGARYDDKYIVVCAKERREYKYVLVSAPKKATLNFK